MNSKTNSARDSKWYAHADDELGDWRLSHVGCSTADIICPHGQAVDLLNMHDYTLKGNDPSQHRITHEDLREWLRENAQWLHEHCANHASHH